MVAFENPDLKMTALLRQAEMMEAPLIEKLHPVGGLSILWLVLVPCNDQ